MSIDKKIVIQLNWVCSLYCRQTPKCVRPLCTHTELCCCALAEVRTKPLKQRIRRKRGDTPFACSEWLVNMFAANTMLFARTIFCRYTRRRQHNKFYIFTMASFHLEKSRYSFVLNWFGRILLLPMKTGKRIKFKRNNFGEKLSCYVIESNE